GTNDAPVITSDTQTGTVQEDTTLTANGTVTADDVDNGAVLSFSGNATGTYGSFAIDAATGEWIYTLDNANQQALAEGETHTDTFTVTVTDEFGATDTQLVTITINGTNDAPVITSDTQYGTVQEDTTLTANGTVTADDVDNGAILSFSGNATGTYGSFVIDAATGEWVYTLNNESPIVQALAQGETHNETFTVTVTDEFGATDTQLVTITITGTNDSPVITNTATALSGEVVEAGNLDDGTVVD
ncbi:VCBS domain-containing protein, partial [Shewanella mangrovi]|uniref:VCBS domain-containing protein n=1 Tax=Shewanella mangrovi TaxID=1515746 RepID=UPI0018869291